MKKLVISVLFFFAISANVHAQDSSSNFDKKFRFGIRVTPQPTWIKSKDKNTTGGGMGFGFGFGLITEFRLSDIIHVYTGIGGDFENGTVNYKQDNANNYEVSYFTNRDVELIELTNGMDTSALYGNGNTGYSGITHRKFKTTYVTIPLTLKMMTQEYSGLRYFAQFGGEIALRTKIITNDDYSKIIKSGGVATSVAGTNTDLDIKKDASLVPIRVGLNVGLGTEYRIAGTTSLMISVNYFTSFTNLMRSTSKYHATAMTLDTNGKMQFTYLKHNLIQNAIRINFGFLF